VARLVLLEELVEVSVVVLLVVELLVEVLVKLTEEVVQELDAVKSVVPHEKFVVVLVPAVIAKTEAVAITAVTSATTRSVASAFMDLRLFKCATAIIMLGCGTRGGRCSQW